MRPHSAAVFAALALPSCIVTPAVRDWADPVPVQVEAATIDADGSLALQVRYSDEQVFRIDQESAPALAKAGFTRSEPSARLQPIGEIEALPDGAALAIDSIELCERSLQLPPAIAERHGRTRLDLPRPPQSWSSPKPWLAMLAMPVALALDAVLVPLEFLTRPFRWPEC